MAVSCQVSGAGDQKLHFPEMLPLISGSAA